MREVTGFFKDQAWTFAPHEQPRLPGSPATPDHPTGRYAGYLDQVDAERTLLAVQQVAIQLQTARLTGLVSLYQAMGGG